MEPLVILQPDICGVVREYSAFANTDLLLPLIILGYLMSGYYGHNHPTTYECVDGSPEFISGYSADQDGALFYFIKPVTSGGGTISSPNYYSDRQLTCVVCTK